MSSREEASRDRIRRFEADDEVPNVIDAYLDGELSVAATLQAHEHFATFENCRRILESEAALHGLLVQASRAETVPTELRSNVLGRLPTGGRARSRRARRRIVRFGNVSGFVGLAVAGWPVHLAVRHAPGAVRSPRVDRASRGRRRALLRVATGRRADLVGREAGRPALRRRVGRRRGRAGRVRGPLRQGRAISARRRGTSCSTRRQIARGSRLAPPSPIQAWSFVTRLWAWPT
jgi:hypothetical protein